MEAPVNALVTVLLAQYDKSLTILSEAIDRYDAALWLDGERYDSPAWQVVYHALFYANIYASATEAGIVPWSKERPSFYCFSSFDNAPPRDELLAHPYSKADMGELVAFVRERLPGYLALMEPQARCWPSWYDEPQLEFHINNIRHIEHHTAQIIERHDIVSTFDYEWY